jgi:hypothetical protein
VNKGSGLYPWVGVDAGHGITCCPVMRTTFAVHQRRWPHPVLRTCISPIRTCSLEEKSTSIVPDCPPRTIRRPSTRWR